MKTLPLAVAAGLLAAGCTDPETVVETRVQRVSQPVLQPCVSGDRPDPVVPLNRQMTRAQWDAQDVKQKSARVAKQGLDRQTYGEKLDAATGGCP